MGRNQTLAVFGDGPDADVIRRSVAAAGLQVAVDPLSAAAVAIVTQEHRSRLAVALMERSGTAVLAPPIALQLGDADALVDAERHRVGHVLYAEPMLHSPLMLHVLDELRLVGALTNVESRAVAPASSSPLSGDDLATLASHPLAATLAVANAGGHGRPRAVAAESSRSEQVTISLEYASGLRATIVAGRGESPEPHWDLQVAGALGVTRATLLPAPELERNGESVAVAGRRPDASPDEHLGAVDMWRTLSDDLGRGRAPAVGAAFGREVLQVLFAAGDALVNARNVALPWTGPRDASLSEYWRRS